MAGLGGPRYQELREASATKWAETANKIATAAAYLLGIELSFVTGSNLLTDGEVIAAMRAGRL